MVREGSGEIRPVTERIMENRDAGSAKQSMTGADRGDGPRSDVGATPAPEPLPFRTPRAALPESVDGLPSFPDTARGIVTGGLARIGLDPPPAARAALEDHARLLLAWTEQVNLTAIRDPDRVAREHVLDSLSAAPILRAGGARQLADLGSGGGYPGIPLAICLPETEVVLIESIAKKASFLGVAVAALGLGNRVAVVNGRAEALGSDGAAHLPFEAVCVRAVADLGVLARLAAPLLGTGGWLVAWKRGNVAAEIAASAGALAAHGFAPPEIHPVEVEGLEGHRLVVATLVRPRRRRW